MRRLSTLLAIALTVTIAACASKSGSASGSSATAARRDPSIMDSTDFGNGDFSTVYDAISRLHSDWLLARGGPSGGRMPQLGVFVEGQQRERGVDFLRTLRPADVRKIRRLSTTESLSSYNWPWGGLVITTRF